MPYAQSQGTPHALQPTWHGVGEYRLLVPMPFVHWKIPGNKYGPQSSPRSSLSDAPGVGLPATRSSRHSRCNPESKRWSSEPATHRPARSHRYSYRDIHRQRSVPAACAGQLPASPHVAYRVLQVPLLDEEYGNDDAGRASDDASLRQLHDDN